jgi:hypothetical protein
VTAKNDTIQKEKRGEKRMKKRMAPDETMEAEDYDEHGVLKKIMDEPLNMGLETELRGALLSGTTFPGKQALQLYIQPLGHRLGRITALLPCPSEHSWVHKCWI